MATKQSAARLVFVSSLATIALAQSVLAQPYAGDPPTRVARLAYVQGPVSFDPAGYDDWFPAQRNRPLTTGDQLWGDQGSLTELQLDGAQVLLGDYSAFSFLNLSDSMTQIQLTSGTMILHIRRLDDQSNYEVDTPNLAFTILRPGTYRISVDPDGQTTTIATAQGYGQVTGGGSAYSVNAGEADVFLGEDGLYENSYAYSPAHSPFDYWSEQREARFDAAFANPYYGPGLIGAADLAAYGDWVPTPGYGPVWYPRGLDAEWAPYQRGHWAYIAPWGYTWIDDQPWGFAPFHYGRWVNVAGAWGWVPGPAPQPHTPWARPVYAPALVAWIGIGASIGWFPLGPSEVYLPTYHVSRDYVNRVNVTNTTVNAAVVNNYYTNVVVNRNVTDVHYANRAVPGAVAALPPQGLAGGQAVTRGNTLHGAAVPASATVRFAPPAPPPSRAAIGGGAGPAANRPPEAVQARTVVARVAPPLVPQHAGAPGSALRSAPLVRVAPPAAPKVAQTKSAQPAPTISRGLASPGERAPGNPSPAFGGQPSGHPREAPSPALLPPGRPAPDKPMPDRPLPDRPMPDRPAGPANPVFEREPARPPQPTPEQYPQHPVAISPPAQALPAKAGPTPAQAAEHARQVQAPAPRPQEEHAPVKPAPKDPHHPDKPDDQGNPRP